MSSISLISFWFLQFWSSAEQNRKERPSFFRSLTSLQEISSFRLVSGSSPSCPLFPIRIFEQDHLRVVLFFQFGFFEQHFVPKIQIWRITSKPFFHGHICFQIVYADIQKTNPVRIFEQQTWTFLIIRHFFEIWICFRTQTLYLRLSFVALFGWSAFFLTRFSSCM